MAQSVFWRHWARLWATVWLPSDLAKFGAACRLCATLFLLAVAVLRPIAAVLWFIWAAVWLSSGLAKFGAACRLRASLFLLAVAVLRPIAAVLWFIDELLFAKHYKAVEVNNPIFIVSGARTGSTRLHEVILIAGGSDFASFKLYQFIFPFICVQRLLSLINRIDQRFLSGALWNFVLRLQAKLTHPEVQKKHPIFIDHYEEDEFWFACWHLTGVFITHLLPSTVTCDMTEDRLSATQLDGLMADYKQCVQKLLFLQAGTVERANRLRFVSKSHGLYRSSAIQRAFPTASFVTVIRNPAESIPSYLSLRDSCLKMLSGVSLFDKDCAGVLARQLRWDAAYFQRELAMLSAPDSTHTFVPAVAKITRAENKNGDDSNTHPKSWVAVRYEHLQNQLLVTVQSVLNAVKPAHQVDEAGLKRLEREESAQKQFRSQHNTQGLLQYTTQQFTSDFGAYCAFCDSQWPAQ